MPTVSGPALGVAGAVAVAWAFVAVRRRRLMQRRRSAALVRRTRPVLAPLAFAPVPDRSALRLASLAQMAAIPSALSPTATAEPRRAVGAALAAVVPATPVASARASARERTIARMSELETFIRSPHRTDVQGSRRAPRHLDVCSSEFRFLHGAMRKSRRGTARETPSPDHLGLRA